MLQPVDIVIHGVLVDDYLLLVLNDPVDGPGLVLLDLVVEKEVEVSECGWVLGRSCARIYHFCCINQVIFRGLFRDEECYAWIQLQG